MKSKTEIVIDSVSKQCNVGPADLKNKYRYEPVCLYRHAAMWVARQLHTGSFPRIADNFSGRDHTTAMYAVRKIDRLRETRPLIRQMTDMLLEGARQQVEAVE